VSNVTDGSLLLVVRCGSRGNIGLKLCWLEAVCKQPGIFWRAAEYEYRKLKLKKFIAPIADFQFQKRCHRLSQDVRPWISRDSIEK
jgi:hypothetical protein